MRVKLGYYPVLDMVLALRQIYSGERFKPFVNSSTVSRHFKLFKDTGFVDIYSQDGNSIYYVLDKGEIKKALDKIYDYIVKKA